MKATVQTRAAYLKQLRRREVKSLSCDGTLADVIRFIDQRPELEEVLEEVATLRETVTGRRGKKDLPKPLALGAIRVPVDAKTARKCGATIDMRGQDASISATFGRSYGIHEDAYYEWREGGGEVDAKYLPKVAKDGRARYVRAVHVNYVRSFAVIRSARIVDYVCHDRIVSVELPAGYHWDRSNGLRAVCDDSPRDDYHPEARDLIDRDAATRIINRLEANRVRRQRIRAKRAAEIADAEGVYVCVADSLRAGNCPVGTADFAKRHNLNTRRHYAASELLVLANGELGRVRLAIKAASIRHREETERGYCVLADHVTR